MIPRTSIDATYQDGGDAFAPGDFAHVSGPLYFGALRVPGCLRLSGFPATRYAIAAPGEIAEVLEGETNRIGDFTQQNTALTIGSTDHTVYVSIAPIDCETVEGQTWRAR